METTANDIKKQIAALKKQIAKLEYSVNTYRRWTTNGWITSDGKYALDRIQAIKNEIPGIEMII